MEKFNLHNIELTDKVFKSLKHCTGDYKVKTNGSSLIKGLYNPDLSIEDHQGNVVYIIENERKTDRKAFIGDVVKAAHYCDITDTKATLIIVMKENLTQTTVAQISNQVNIYYQWMKSKGILSLKDIIIISDLQYKYSIEHNEIIGSKEFIRRGFSCLEN